MDLANFFDRCVVISLKRRNDRLNSFWEQLKKHGWPFREPEVFEAVDGSVVPTPPGWKGGSGAWGCCQSHRAVLQRAIMDGVENLLVMEDDMCMRSSFLREIEVFLSTIPQDYNGLMLGGQHLQRPIPVKPGIVRCTNCQRTHAYSMRGSYLKDLYAHWCSPAQSTHIDHTMGPFQVRYRIYAPEPLIFGQARTRSDINCRINPAKFWVSPSGQEPVVVLRAPIKIAQALSGYGFHRGYDRDTETDIDQGLQSVFAGSKSLTEWINELQWECTSEEGWICTVWHPEATLEMVKKAWSGPVIEICASNVEEALAQRPVAKVVSAKVRPIVILQATHEVAEKLPWHRGYWRDPVTDVDNGLRKAIEAGGSLEEVIRVLLQESEEITDGVACLWYPMKNGEQVLTREQVSQATLWPVVEICANSAEEALEQWQKYL